MQALPTITTRLGYTVPRTVNFARFPLAIVHAHPRDKEVLFDEGPHTYYVKGSSAGYTSVTTFIHVFFPVFDEAAAIEGLLSREDFPLGARYVKKYGHVVCPGGVRLPPSEAKQAIAAEWERVRTEASTLGTAFHEDCERHLNAPPALVLGERAALMATPDEPAGTLFARWLAEGEENKREVEEAQPGSSATAFDLTVRSPDTVEFGYFLDYAKRMREKGYHPWRTEAIVWDEDLRLVGSVDMQWIHEDDLAAGRRRIHLADWKRSKEIRRDNRFGCGLGPLAHLPDCNLAHYRLQLNLYTRLLETKYETEVSAMTIVVCHPNNDACVEIPVERMDMEIDAMFEARRHQLASGISDHDLPDVLEGEPPAKRARLAQ
jgi:hypothetical protein